MSEAYVGELRIFAFGITPKNWAPCNGQLLSISSNQALFAILGTSYGGDGRTTFGLPDLRGTAPIHFGTGGGATYSLGQRGGEENHILSLNEMPAHAHTPNGAGNAANQASPAGNLLGTTGFPAYAPPGSLVSLAPGAIGSTGNGQGHPNMQPYQALNVCICLFGIFPSRN